MTTLNWLPVPVDFRPGLKAAAACSDAAERLEALAALAQYRLGFLETIQLDNALKGAAERALATAADHALATAGEAKAAGFARLRLAILSSATIDHLLPPIRVAGLRRRLLIDVHTGAYGQYRQELLDPSSALQAARPDVILFSLGCRETLAGVPITASAEEVRRAVAATMSDLRDLWRRARESLGAAVIQQTFLDVTEPLFGNFDRLVPGSPSRVVAGLNEALGEAAAQDGVLLLDVARYAARDGLDAWFDTARWLQGKIEIAPQAAPLYGDLVARLIAAQRGLSKKCLVLDLDNTLWGGVIGDVGLENIVLGAGSGAGEAHLALQQYARALKERGIVLAVCSKNEHATAEAAFLEHPEMALKRADITAFVANWSDKAENLKAIATQLNIGIDSLVFVDDNPAERARIRESLAMVAVPELPDDPAGYVRCIASAGYFEAAAFTAEDRERAAQYAANIERESLRGSLQSMDDFLRGLDMTVVYGQVGALDLPRAVQLVNKTNQFNTTTRRYGGDELAALAADARHLVLQFRLADRFGDNGLVSVMTLCRDDADAGVLDIASWVMSCRVFGRQLEDEAMNVAVEFARARGVRSLRARIIATQKNAVIADLYANLGFTRLPEPEAGTSAWTLNLADYSSRNTFITRRAQA